jgi:hypothetical protein
MDQFKTFYLCLDAPENEGAAVHCLCFDDPDGESQIPGVRIARQCAVAAGSRPAVARIVVHPADLDRLGQV